MKIHNFIFTLATPAGIRVCVLSHTIRTGDNSMVIRCFLAVVFVRLGDSGCASSTVTKCQGAINLSVSQQRYTTTRHVTDITVGLHSSAAQLILNAYL